MPHFFSRSSRQQRPRSNNENPYPDPIRLSEDRSADQVASSVLKSAINYLLDGTRPEPKAARSQMSTFFRALKKKLQPRSREVDVPTSIGSARGYMTDLHGVFKHSQSDAFSIALSPTHTVERTESELQTHVAIQSYLKHQFGDPSVDSQAVITPADLQNARYTSSRRPGGSAANPAPSTGTTSRSTSTSTSARNAQPGSTCSIPAVASVIGHAAAPPTAPSAENLSRSRPAGLTRQGRPGAVHQPESARSDLRQNPAGSTRSAGPSGAALEGTAAASTSCSPVRQDRSTRTEAVLGLTDILSRNAIQKAERILEIETQYGGFPSTGMVRSELNKLQFDAGENLRLLQHLRCNLPAVRSTTTVDARIADAVNALLADAQRASTPGAHRAMSSDPMASSTPPVHTMQAISSRVVGALHDANTRFETCKWVSDHHLVPVKNGGEEFIPGDDEGNNCLLVTILQHATGDYANRFHAEMVKALREALVAKFPAIDYAAPLHQDTEAIEWLRQTVNDLYGRDLQFVSVMMTPSENAAGVAALISHTSAGGTEPALIWEKATHYEALVTSDQAPAAETPSTLKNLEQQTGLVQARLQAALAAPAEHGNAEALAVIVNELNQCLENEMAEVRLQIRATSRPSTGLSSGLIDEDALNSGAPSSQSRDPVRRVLNQIGEHHPAALSRKKSAELRESFKERIYCYKLSIPDQFHRLLTVQAEFEARPPSGTNWSSLIP